jgi:hypothetical protein
VLGLGDTNYSQFCQTGKNFHRRMSELGAKPFYDPGRSRPALSASGFFCANAAFNCPSIRSLAPPCLAIYNVASGSCQAQHLC